MSEPIEREKQSSVAPYGAAMTDSSSTRFGTWTLAQAMDALVASARAAGHPGWLWLAGMLYPTLTLGLDLGWDGLLTLSTDPESIAKRFGLEFDATRAARTPLEFVWQSIELTPKFAVVMIGLLVLGFFMLPFFRLVAGLVRIAPPSAWNAACNGRRIPTLRTAWAAGKGLTRGMFGLWIQVALMTICALLALGLPAAGLLALANPGAGGTFHVGHVLLLAALVGPLLCVLVPYALALSVLNQLAMHSLAHNRRGVSSALLHAWRIMRNDPWATGRAILVDVILFAIMLAVWRVISGPIELVLRGSKPGQELAHIVQYILIGIAGVARAGYWARAYRALGGLSPDDGVPGLGATLDPSAVPPATGTSGPPSSTSLAGVASATSTTTASA